MAFDFKLPFTKIAAPDAADEPLRKPLPLIGHLDIQTQFRALGTVFVVSLLVTIAALYMQVQASARGAAYLSVASRLAPLTQQIPKAALIAMHGQAEGFAELRDARSNFRQLIESLVEGGEIKGVTVAATSVAALPALDALRAAWGKQNEIIDQLLKQEARLVALGRVGKEALQQGQAMSAAAEAAGGKLPFLTERILRAAQQLTWAPGLDEAVSVQLA
jgi:hypothetical protein